jgi:hypothetical protein
MLGDYLNHSHDVWSISTRAVVGDSNVPNLLKDKIKSIELCFLCDGLEQIPLKLRHPRRITHSMCQSPPYDPMKNYHLRLEVGDGRSIEVQGLIHGCHLTQAKHITIVKIEWILSRSSKAQDRCKPTNRNGVLSVVGHPSNARVVLVEEEGGVELKDHFFIPIIPKSHDLLESMVLAHINHIIESWTIFLVLL